MKETLLEEAKLTFTDEIKSYLKKETITQEPIKKVLLTGANGFLGCHILHHLLSQGPQLILNCIIRARDEAHGLQRIRDAFTSQGLSFQDQWLEGSSPRLLVIPGDLAQDQLGLSSRQYDELAESVDSVIHNAAVISPNQNYEQLKASNVTPTKNMLYFAAQGRLKPFTFISTISVCDRSLEEIPESYTGYHEGLLDGYQQSKWVAEQFVFQAAQLGLPAQTLRLGRVSGSLKTPFVNPNDLIWRIIASSMRIQKFPAMPIKEPWTPADLLAKEIFSLAEDLSLRKAPSSDRVFHLLPDSEILLKTLYEWVQDFGYPYPLEIMPSWFASLSKSEHADDKILQAFFEKRLKKGGKPSNPSFSKQHFTSIRDYNSNPFPALEKEDFYGYLEFAVQHELLPPPPQRATPSHVEKNVEN